MSGFCIYRAVATCEGSHPALQWWSPSPLRKAEDPAHALSSYSHEVILKAFSKSFYKQKMQDSTHPRCQVRRAHDYFLPAFSNVCNSFNFSFQQLQTAWLIMWDLPLSHYCPFRPNFPSASPLLLLLHLLTHYGSAFSCIACGIWTWRPSPVELPLGFEFGDRQTCSEGAYVKKNLVKQRVS